MDNPGWLRFLTIGLVLAALAVGYFLLTGRLASNKVTKTQSSPPPSVLGQNAQPTPSSNPSATPASAYSRIVDRSQGGIQTLPKTGFPVGLAVAFSVSAIISGWGLRRYPR